MTSVISDKALGSTLLLWGKAVRSLISDSALGSILLLRGEIARSVISDKVLGGMGLSLMELTVVVEVCFGVSIILLWLLVPNTGSDPGTATVSNVYIAYA